MEHALKQRLVGALVITALAAIFVPMFFEDSVDDSRREVNNSDLAIPAPPEQLLSDDNPIPQSPQQILHATEDEAEASDAEEQLAENSATPSKSAADTATEHAAERADSEQPAAPADEPLTGAPKAAAAEPLAEAGKPIPQNVAPTPTQPKPVSAQAIKPRRQPVASQPAIAQAAPAQAAAPAPKQAATVASPVASPALQRWVLQLGSFAKKDNADALVNQLRGQGFNAYGDSIQVAGKGTMFRVRVGPELDKKRAQAAQKKLQQQSGLKSILLSE